MYEIATFYPLNKNFKKLKEIDVIHYYYKDLFLVMQVLHVCRRRGKGRTAFRLNM